MQTLGAYKKIAELLNIPSNFVMLDIGCMCGFLKHYLDQRIKYKFDYVGIDKWPEAITVAREFLPRDNFQVMDFAKDAIEVEYDYVCMTNLLLRDNVKQIFEKAIRLSRKAFLFSIPVRGQNLNQTGIARTENMINTLLSFGLHTEQFDCGQSLLIKVNTDGNNHIC